jgi:hypothetical protein
MPSSAHVLEVRTPVAWSDGLLLSGWQLIHARVPMPHVSHEGGGALSRDNLFPSSSPGGYAPRCHLWPQLTIWDRHMKLAPTSQACTTTGREGQGAGQHKDYESPVWVKQVLEQEQALITLTSPWRRSNWTSKCLMRESSLAPQSATPSVTPPCQPAPI